MSTLTVASVSLTGIEDDTGTSSSDFITSDPTLTLTGTASVSGNTGAPVAMGIWIAGGAFGDGDGGRGVLVGSFTFDNSSNSQPWYFNLADSCNINAQSLADGTYTITLSGGTGNGASIKYQQTLVVDTTAPNSLTDIDGASGGNVDEHAANGTLVRITAHAHDANALLYSISDDPSNGAFAIDAHTGVVTVADGSLLDYDSAHSYNIGIAATDVAGNSITQIFTITLNDVGDDHPPVFISGTTASEAENTAANTIVYTAQATDSHQLAYSLASGGDNDLFSINASTGAVRFLASPDYENPKDSNHDNSYVITVRASDGSHNTTQDVTIAVSDVNDNAPAFVSGITAQEAENTAANTVVYTAQAPDADGTAANNSVAYSLASGGDNDLFSINASTGAVRFLASPDYENPKDSNHDNSYVITVRASDGSHNTTQDVTIAVSDVNDNAPAFVSGITAQEAENTAANTVVYTAQAPDADGTAANNSVAYSLASGGDNDLFSINASTGAVRFLASPDYENPKDSNHDNSYVITVRASDGSHNTTQDVTIAVDNVVGITVSSADLGSHKIIGTIEEDWLTGSSAHDVIKGLGGNDFINGDGDGTDGGGQGGPAGDRLIGGSGNDTIHGSYGADFLQGGSGTDILAGGGGADTFYFQSASDSTGVSYDSILDIDFRYDKIELTQAVTHVNTAISSGDLSSSSFDSDLASVVNASHLGPDHAVAFTASGGTLAGQTFLIVDVNGVAGYQAGQDLVIHLQDGADIVDLHASDFITKII